MTTASAFASASSYRPETSIDERGVRVAGLFTSAAAEYTNVRTGAGLFDRSDRGLLVVTGKDRAAWLHNLVTNAIKSLEVDAGCYAFATDVRGRVQFDLNVLARPEETWLDIDIATVLAALAHLSRYIVVEDVAIADASAAWAQLGVSGPRAADVAAGLGVRDLASRAALSTVALDDGAATLIRHDFAGVLGFELMMRRETATAMWDRIAAMSGVVPAGRRTLDALRIEAGIPWWGRDIDEKTLPPETGQVERGISYHKGCYLGQEVIERMRSHNVLAKRLVKLGLADGDGLSLPCSLQRNGADAGRITSLVKHPVTDDWIGLGYLRTAIADASGLTAGEPPRAVSLR